MSERAGVNYVRGVVEATGCLFKEINLQHDFGHDATVLLVVDRKVQPREIALQVKSGRSYNEPERCLIPATAEHIEFWAAHDLITLGVVYDPTSNSAYWIDLQTECRELKKARSTGGTTIAFPKAAWNVFDSGHFLEVLIPTLLGTAPTVPLGEALAWARSADFGTHDLGVRTLKARHREAPETWECFLSEFASREVDRLAEGIPIAFSQILFHDDIGYYANQISDAVREPVKAALSTFAGPEIAKLLEMVEDGDFNRPSYGYSLMPLWARSPEGPELLRQIRDDPAHPELVRENAATLRAWYEADPEWWSLWRR